MDSEHDAPQFVVIGGGTGNFTILSGLKPIVGYGLTAVVGMADDGGSTGILRDEQGVLPTGDLRQCLVALSNAPQETRDLINYRIPMGASEKGGLGGHTIGNILIAAAEKLNDGDIIAGLNMLSRTLDIRGRVLPATTADCRLRLETPKGIVIEGEHAAEEYDGKSLRGAKVGFDVEPVQINSQADAAIRAADMVIIAPGDLYTSIAPALAVQGMREALVAARRVVLITNLMNRNRHTVGFTVTDYADEVERIVGAPILDAVIYNTEQPDTSTLNRYTHEGEYPVVANQAELDQARYKVVGRPLLSRAKVTVDPNDAIGASRSLIRHDPKRVASTLLAEYWGSAISD